MADLIIVGGGLAGGTLACALAEGGLEVTLVDQIDPRKTPPSDGRSLALSPSSYRLLSTLGLWQELGEVTPIRKIHTSDGSLPRWVEYEEGDVAEGPLGYVVDSALLKKKIAEKSLSFKNIKVIAPAKLDHFQQSPTSVEIKTEQKHTLTAQLCVAADGRFSRLREETKIPTRKWSYDQIALVCHMAHTKPHNFEAFEHFLPWGPLAFVPRPGNESGLVWSLEKSKAEVLLHIPPKEFSEEIQALFGNALGTFSLASQRWSAPLGVILPSKIVSGRLALVGDAAHAFHPVAGQGLNVGFRDVRALADILIKAHSLGLDLGSSTVLSQYERARRLDILSMTFLTDGLVKVFSKESQILAHVRSLGFGLVKHLPPLKHMMIRHAMGRVE